MTFYRAHAIEEHWLPSAFVSQNFKITVQHPLSRTDDTELIPVVYAADSDHFFGGYSSMANALQLSGEVPRFILVGIGYGNARAAALLRARDLYTHEVRAHFAAELEHYACSPLAGGVCSMREITQTTDANEFLEFISQELIPFIAARYPVNPSDNSFFGYSAAGGFGLRTLFSKPDTFRRYVLGSPATCYEGDTYAITLAETFRASGRDAAAKVFMSVGELEEFERDLSKCDPVTGLYRLAKNLKTSPIAGLELTMRVFPGETHATAWTAAFSQGLKTVLSPATQAPFGPECRGS